MNEEERVIQDLKEILLRNAPKLTANAKRQLDERGFTDDETTLHAATHSIFFSSEKLNKLTKLLTGMTIVLTILTAVNIGLLVCQILGGR